MPPSFRGRSASVCRYLAVLVLAVGGCASGPRAYTTLDAALWMQTSEEYAAVTRQAYRQAAERLEAALRDTAWSAALEQGPRAGGLPPAVVLDVDETVLDNSAYAARLLRAGEEFTPETWDAWVEEARAPAVPGALEFLRRARARGVHVVFLTNREAHLEAATRRNLAAVGFEPAPEDDAVLMKGEQESWGSDKSSRRAHVAGTHRILFLFGDDFNDFVPARWGLDARRELGREHADHWGVDWFALPNPTYGSWEAAITRFPPAADGRSALERKLETLDPGT
ncbi:MAG: HAD family acid phosphatase [Gemmatimonadota bacterium]|nr:HAD family acid phosphatase [Gemmatimonadota bacterium]